MSISPEAWHGISRWLDEALDLEPGARAAWLAALETSDPSAAAAVSAWLGHFDAMVAEGFLESGSAAPARSALVGLEVGPYRLVEPIGHGGMGTVWLAERRDGRFEQRVAVKVLNAALLGHGGAERFAREAGILARLTHPQIAHLMDAGISSLGVPYLVIEHVAGEHIDRHCDARRLTIAERLQLFLDIVDPVVHAHANLIVHRDIKPANVLVTDDGHVKLLDFGIARLVQADGDQTPAQREATRDAALTPAYAAPEQLTGGAITTSTDVHALGVLLYQLLSGRHPFADAVTTPAGLIEAIVGREPLAPSSAAGLAPADETETAESMASARRTTVAGLRHALAGDLDTIIGTALRKDPAARYATASALADDIRRHLRHEPIAARAHSVSYRLSRLVRRHRAPFALAAVAVLALVAGLIGTISQARRAEAQRLRADAQATEATVQRDFARRQLARAEAINDLNGFLLSDAAPLGATFTADELLERAERIVERQQGDEPDVRAGILGSIGRLYEIRGRTERATRVLSEAYALSRAVPDPAVQGEASCALATAIVRTGDIARAGRLIDEGLALLPDAPQFHSARLYCHLHAVSVQSWAGDGERAVEHALQAQALAAEAGLDSSLMRLRIALDLGEAYRIADRDLDADEAFSVAWEQMVALGRDETERAGTLLNNWGLVLGSMGRTLESERMFRRAVEISSAVSDDRVEPVLWTNLARALFELARVPEARALAARGHAGALALGDVIVADQALLLRARIELTYGDVSRGDALLAEADAHYRARFPPLHPARVAVARDRVSGAARRGDLRRALALADEAVRMGEADPRVRSSLDVSYRQRAEIRVKLGEFEEARADAAQALAVVLEGVSPGTVSGAVGLAQLVLGEAYAGEGRMDDARGAWRTAVRHLEAALGPEHPSTVRARARLAG